MPVEDHPVFRKPDNPDVKIWRYMDFAKYVSFLDSKALFFPRSDRLDDPYEGIFTTPTWGELERIIEQYVVQSGGDLSEVDIATEVDQVKEANEAVRSWTYVNSWHMNEVESAAMWDLYAKRDQGIAIQSTYAKLAACLPAKVPSRVFKSPKLPNIRIVVDPANVYVGEVTYVYETEPIDTGNSFYPHTHKRKSFEHERELRAVVREFPQVQNLATGGRFSLNLNAVNNPLNGLRVNVPVAELVEKVLVAPTAPAWFGELVKNVSKKYGLNSRCVDNSRLYERHIV